MKIENWELNYWRVCFFFFHQLIIFKCHNRYKKERNLILDWWSTPSSRSSSPLCALQKTEVRYGWSLFFNVLLFYLYHIWFVLLVCDCTMGLANGRRTFPSTPLRLFHHLANLLPRNQSPLEKDRRRWSPWRCVCVKSKQQQKQQMEAGQSPLFFVKRKKVPSPSSCLVPFSGVSFLPVSLWPALRGDALGSNR